MTSTPKAGKPPRRRRSKAEAENEILDAAERFLEQRSWHDLSIEGVMAGTTMTKMAFYHYFADRKALFFALLQRAGDDLSRMTDRWLIGEATLYENALAAQIGAAEVYRRRGRLIRASTEAAAEDPELRQVREAILHGFIDRTEQWITQRQRSGDLPPLTAGATPRTLAEALITMGDSYLQRCYGWTADGPHETTVANTLLQIWVGALYQITPDELKDCKRR